VGETGNCGVLPRNQGGLLAAPVIMVLRQCPRPGMAVAPITASGRLRGSAAGGLQTASNGSHSWSAEAAKSMLLMALDGRDGRDGRPGSIGQQFLRPGRQRLALASARLSRTSMRPRALFENRLGALFDGHNPMAALVFDFIGISSIIASKHDTVVAKKNKDARR